MYGSGSPGGVTDVRQQRVGEVLSAGTTRSGALCQLARSRRDPAREHRAKARKVRQDTIPVRWRARQLRYDRHGPIVAVWDGDREASEEAFGPNSVVNGLFELGVILAALHKSLDGDHRGQVGAAIDRVDRLICEIRVAALARQSELRASAEKTFASPTAAGTSTSQ